MTTIITLQPFNVQLGGFDPGVGYDLTAPVQIGDGSLIDGSDASGQSLGGYLDNGGVYRSDSVNADFRIDASLQPTWMYLSLRAQTPAGYSQPIDQRYIYRADAPSLDTLAQHGAWPEPLRDGTAPAPTWFDYFYAGNPILPGDPGDATNWANLPRDWPDILEPLTGAGIRVTFYGQTSEPTRVPFMDLFEIRLVLACEAGRIRPYRARQRLYPIAPARRWPREAWTGSSARRVGGYR